MPWHQFERGSSPLQSTCDHHEFSPWRRVAAFDLRRGVVMEIPRAVDDDATWMGRRWPRCCPPGLWPTVAGQNCLQVQAPTIRMPWMELSCQVAQVSEGLSSALAFLPLCLPLLAAFGTALEGSLLAPWRRAPSGVVSAPSLKASTPVSISISTLRTLVPCSVAWVGVRPTRGWSWRRLAHGS